MNKGKARVTLGEGPDGDWMAESDLRTLMEARAIQNDPKRLAKAKALAKQKMLDAAAVAGGAGEDD